MADHAKHARELIKAYVREKMPDDIKRLVQDARADLNFGPAHANPSGEYETDAYPGFETATGKIAAWVSDNMPSELWADWGSDFVSESAPEGEEVDGEWQEPFTEETYHFDRLAIKRATFGELADYL